MSDVPVHAPGEGVDLSGACDDCRGGFHGDCRGVEQVVRGESPCPCDCPDALTSQARASTQQKDHT